MIVTNSVSLANGNTSLLRSLSEKNSAGGKLLKHLEKSELLDDIFSKEPNSQEDSTKSNGEYVYISHASKKVQSQFLLSVEKFLHEHKDLIPIIEAIAIPDDFYLESKTKKQPYWMMRRLNRYWSWYHTNYELLVSTTENLEESFSDEIGCYRLFSHPKSALISGLYQLFCEYYSLVTHQSKNFANECTYFYAVRPSPYRF